MQASKKRIEDCTTCFYYVEDPKHYKRPLNKEWCGDCFFIKVKDRWRKKSE